jgi:hypothetical protein
MVRSLLAIVFLACGCKPAASDPPTVSPVSDEPPSEQHIAEARWNDAAAIDEPAPPPEEPPSPPPVEPTDEGSAWDRDNFAVLTGYVHDLQCFARRAHEMGVAAAGAEAGSKRRGRWEKFTREHVVRGDQWHAKVLAQHPSIAEDSKLYPDLKELHDLAIHRIPKAYASGETGEIDKVVTFGGMIETSIDKYALELGLPMSDATAAHCKAMRLP